MHAKCKSFTGIYTIRTSVTLDTVCIFQIQITSKNCTWISNDGDGFPEVLASSFNCLIVLKISFTARGITPKK